MHLIKIYAPENFILRMRPTNLQYILLMGDMIIENIQRWKVEAVVSYVT